MEKETETGRQTDGGRRGRERKRGQLTLVNITDVSNIVVFQVPSLINESTRTHSRLKGYGGKGECFVGCQGFQLTPVCEDRNKCDAAPGT